MAEVADCCGCCLLCCACVSVCGRLCLWIPWVGDRRKAKTIEEDEEFARQVERETFGMPPPASLNYAQPAPQDAPISNPTRQSRSASNPATYEDHQGGGRSSDGPAQGNASSEHQEPLPPRISQDPNLPSSFEYPPQPPRDDRPTHVRGPSSNSGGHPAQQQAASSLPPNEHRRVRSND